MALSYVQQSKKDKTLHIDKLYNFLDGRVDRMDITLRLEEVDRLKEELNLEMDDIHPDEDDDNENETLSYKL